MRDLTPTEAQWLFSRAALDVTPSRDAGVSLQSELEGRKEVIEYIESLALRSGLGSEDPDATRLRKVMLIAATLVHRFYMRRSITDFKPKLMAPTILFLSSKIDEEPLKLRHIVNACLAKWDQQATQWVPSPDNKDSYPPQSREYQAWERDVLAAEEIALDALCFDMTVDNPREVIDQALDGLSTRLDPEMIIAQAMYLLHDSIRAPLSVLYRPRIVAIGTIALVITLTENVYLAQGLAAAAELGSRFGVDVQWTERGMAGQDAESVKSFCEDYIAYARMGITDPDILGDIDTNETELLYTRLFPDLGPGDTGAKPNGVSNGHAKINGVS